jgi:hypothetical protein
LDLESLGLRRFSESRIPIQYTSNIFKKGFYTLTLIINRYSQLMVQYKLDRNSFRMFHTTGAPNNYLYWNNEPLEERLKAANYLNNVPFNFPEKNLRKIGKSYFKIRKRK